MICTAVIGAVIGDVLSGVHLHNLSVSRIRVNYPTIDCVSVLYCWAVLRGHTEVLLCGSTLGF